MKNTLRATGLAAVLLAGASESAFARRGIPVDTSVLPYFFGLIIAGAVLFCVAVVYCPRVMDIKSVRLEDSPVAYFARSVSMFFIVAGFGSLLWGALKA